jgi:hypothetical protein
VRNVDDWRRQAACQTIDSELFFPVGIGPPRFSDEALIRAEVAVDSYTVADRAFDEALP